MVWRLGPPCISSANSSLRLACRARSARLFPSQPRFIDWPFPSLRKASQSLIGGSCHFARSDRQVFLANPVEIDRRQSKSSHGPDGTRTENGPRRGIICPLPCEPGPVCIETRSVVRDTIWVGRLQVTSRAVPRHQRPYILRVLMEQARTPRTESTSAEAWEEYIRTPLRTQYGLSRSND